MRSFRFSSRLKVYAASAITMPPRTAEPTDFASFREMLKFLSCATLYTVVARCIPFYTTFGLHLPVFGGFSRHKGMPLGYSIQFCGVYCTDQRFQICVSELITLPFWSGYVGFFVVLFVLKKYERRVLYGKKTSQW